MDICHKNTILVFEVINNFLKFLADGALKNNTTSSSFRTMKILITLVKS